MPYSQSHLEGGTNHDCAGAVPSTFNQALFLVEPPVHEDQRRLKGGSVGSSKDPCAMELGMHTWFRAFLCPHWLHYTCGDLAWIALKDHFPSLCPSHPAPCKFFLLQISPGFSIAFRLKSTFLSRIYKVIGYPAQDPSSRSSFPTLKTTELTGSCFFIKVTLPSSVCARSLFYLILFYFMFPSPRNPTSTSLQ